MKTIQFVADAHYGCLPEPILFKKGSRHEMRDDMAARWIKRNVAVYVTPRSPVEFKEWEQTVEAVVVAGSDPIASGQNVESGNELPLTVEIEDKAESEFESAEEVAEETTEPVEDTRPAWMKKLEDNVAEPVAQPAKRPYNRRK